MIRTMIVAAAVLSSVPQALAQATTEYWYIGMSSGNGGVADAVTFIDANRVQGTGSVRRAWVWGFFEEVQPRPDDITRMQKLEEYDCAQRRSRSLQSTAYFRDARSVPETIAETEQWSYVTPETSGEWMLDFVCGNRETRLASHRFVQLRDGIKLPDAAAQLFAMARERVRQSGQ